MHGVEAHAQSATKPVVAHIAGGYAEAVGVSADQFDSGWSVYGGATFHPDPAVPVGIRVDLGYSHFSAIHQVVDSETPPRSFQVEDGYRSMTSLSFDAIYEIGSGGHVGGYVVAGVGADSQYVTTTGTVLIGEVSCDPLTHICFISGSGAVLHDSDRLTKLGYNIGAAITFPLASKSEIYIEAQYRRMIESPAVDFIPLIVGYRW
jgi:hypothetical protein